MNEIELKTLTSELSESLIKIGIPISKKIDDVRINKRAKARLGACKTKKSPLGKPHFTIEISAHILDCPIDKISEIIIHELLHTCPGCFNHGKKWKYYGDIVHDKLGYEINTVTKYENLGLEPPKKKQETIYTVRCRGCGQVYIRKRMCSLVKNPQNYRCGKCGSTLYLESKSTTSCR